MRHIAILIFMALTALTYTPGAYGADNNINNLLRNAKRGNAEAMNRLGVAYYTGNGVDRDYDKAYYWWREGALRQNPKAIANLGVCYQYGRGVQADSVTAMRLYLHAISEGQTELLAQRRNNAGTNAFDAMLAGLCHERGIGTPADIRYAASTYARAADQGSVDGMLYAGKAYKQIGQNDKATTYLERAVKARNPEAQYILGRMLLDGDGITQNKPRAMELIRAAAQADNTAAQDLMGMMYLEGNGVYRSRPEAMKWLAKSAANGNAQGMWDYATALRDDTAEDVDMVNALYWYAQASQSGRTADFARMFNSLGQNSPFRNYVSGMKCYLIDKNYDRANTYFKRIDRANNVSDEGKIAQAMVLADTNNPKGDRDKALGMLRKLSTPRARQVIADIYDGKPLVHPEVMTLLTEAFY